MWLGGALECIQEEGMRRDVLWGSTQVRALLVEEAVAWAWGRSLLLVEEEEAVTWVWVRSLLMDEEAVTGLKAPP